MPVLFDTEFTAWEGSAANRWLAPGQFREIVQIGAVRVDRASLAAVAEFNVLVRPRINPDLSDYFSQLTGIANAAVKDCGVDFSDALGKFLEFVGDDVMAAFGRDDLVLLENLALYGIANAPPLPAHINIAI